MNIDQIVQVNITRTSAVATLPGFGVPGIIAQFAAKTAFPTRTKFYASTADMTADALPASVLAAGAKVFAQSPKVPRLLVGRLDSGDASMAAGLDAIRGEQDDWYAFTVVGYRSIKFVLSDDMVPGNVLTSSINGVSISPITWATSHAATMSAWETAIESAIAGATATVSGREMTVVLVGTDMNIGTFSIAGGSTVPTATITYPLDATKTKAIMAWAETQKKIFIFSDSDPATYAADTNTAGTACLAEFAKLNSYERTAVVFHGLGAEYIEAAWMGKELPYDPGSRTWAIKNLAGVTPDALTISQDGLIRGKNANTYTTTAGFSHTYAGTCAKASTYIDDIRGLDWFTSTSQTSQFNLLGTTGKVPMTDAGIQLVVNALKGDLALGEQRGVFAPGWEVTFPAASAISAEDRAARRLTGISFSATLAGAVHSIIISGTVTA